MRSERDLQAYVKKECARLNILCYKLEATSHRGMPDLILLRDGHTVFAEVKSPTGRGRVTALQHRMHERLRDAGFDVWIVDSVDEANRLVTTFGKTRFKWTEKREQALTEASIRHGVKVARALANELSRKS